MVRRHASAVSNHEAPVPIPGLVLRDACCASSSGWGDKAGYDAV